MRKPTFIGIFDSSNSVVTVSGILVETNSPDTVSNTVKIFRWWVIASDRERQEKLKGNSALYVSFDR
jgi:hypothetical protein